jgi:sugar phosphate isomerase/epimerase
MPSSISRRDLLVRSGLAAGVGMVTSSAVAAEPEKAKTSFRFCLNTSTIRGQKLPLTEVVDIAGKAGYEGIEPWIGEIETYVKAGGSLADMRKRIADHGLTVESAIGFANWIVDDDTKRAEALEGAKRDMDLVHQIGGRRIAAPPVGAHREAGPDLLTAAKRYRALLDLGDKMDVVPQVEVWGFSKTLSRLGEAVLVAIESGHPRACVLPDVYHIYKGGSAFTGLSLLSSTSMHAFHMNDYPTNIPRDKVSDAQRVYPGDGDAPLDSILQTLRTIGFTGALSL